MPLFSSSPGWQLTAWQQEITTGRSAYPTSSTSSTRASACSTWRMTPCGSDTMAWSTMWRRSRRWSTTCQFAGWPRSLSLAWTSRSGKAGDWLWETEPGLGPLHRCCTLIRLEVKSREMPEAPAAKDTLCECVFVQMYALGAFKMDGSLSGGVAPKTEGSLCLFLCDPFWFCSCFTHYAVGRSLADHIILMFEPKDVQSSLRAFKVCFVFVDVCACSKKGEKRLNVFVLFVSLIKIWWCFFLTYCLSIDACRCPGASFMEELLDATKQF